MSTIDLSKPIGDAGAATTGQIETLRNRLGILADIAAQDSQNASTEAKYNDHILAFASDVHRADQIYLETALDDPNAFPALGTITNVAQALSPLYQHINDSASIAHEANTIRIDKDGAEASLRYLTSATDLEQAIVEVANSITTLQSDLEDHATGTGLSHFSSSIAIDDNFLAFSGVGNVGEALTDIYNSTVRITETIAAKESDIADALAQAAQAVIDANLALNDVGGFIDQQEALIAAAIAQNDSDIAYAVQLSNDQAANYAALAEDYTNAVAASAAIQTTITNIIAFYDNATSYDFGTKLGWFKGYNRIVPLLQDVTFVVNVDTPTTYSAIEQIQNALRAFDYIAPGVTLTIEIQRPSSATTDVIDSTIIGDSVLTDYLPAGPGKVVITGEKINGGADTGLIVQNMDLTFATDRHAPVEFTYLDFENCTFTIRGGSTVTFQSPCNFSDAADVFKVFDDGKVILRPAVSATPTDVEIITFTNCDPIFAGAMGGSVQISQPMSSFDAVSTANTFGISLVSGTTLISTENVNFGNTMSFFSQYDIDTAGATVTDQLPTENTSWFYLAGLI